jgi:hypothetical protein
VAIARMCKPLSCLLLLSFAAVVLFYSLLLLIPSLVDAYADIAAAPPVEVWGCTSLQCCCCSAALLLCLRVLLTLLQILLDL